jgi:NAD(P)-dependent dehydrogenase (short-subunit alcohol dehydrogenase family)
MTGPTRTALITGSNGGIGRALCQAFAEAGYRVIGMDRVGTPTGTDAKGLVTIKQDIRVFATDTPARAAAFAELGAAIGADGLTVLVNNAATQRLAPTDSITVEEVEETLATNVIAPLMLVQGLLPALERAGGSVVNIGSVHATATKREFVAYATSKAALAGLTRALAVDLGGRVRVNNISPGAIATPMLEAGFEGRPEARKQLDAVHPLGRVGTPMEVAQAALFLAGPGASNITGLDLRVDGGVAARLHDPA